MGIQDFTVYDVISRNAEMFGKKIAWYDDEDGKEASFAEYKTDVDRLASGLKEAGIKKGDRIGVVGKNSYSFFLLYGAAAAIGAIMLPINWRLSAEEMAFNLNDCTPVVVFADAEYQDMIEGLKEKIPSVRRFFNLEPDKGKFDPLNDLFQDSRDGFKETVNSGDGYVIIHTAAVEGRPRGALLSHQNVLFANFHLNYHMQVTQEDVHLNLLPLFHVGGLFMATNSFHAGATNINMKKFEAKRACSLIAEKGISLMFDFAPILSSILDESDKNGYDIHSLQKVIGIEAPETIETYQDKIGGTFYCMYGQTETSCLATLGKYRDRPGSAGRVIHYADVRLVDDYDNPVPRGTVGEITMKGPMVFLGYWNLKEDTDYAFRENRHHTGDLGMFDEDGFLFFKGRKAEKELIKPGGENVYPAEVEKAILLHPDVKRTVVFGVPDPKWKEGIKAVCVLEKGSSLSPRELIAFVGERIARFKKPQYVEFIEEIPEKDDGTPDREKIKEMYGGEQ